ncbi:type VI secretion system amidase immunity protein Tai4 [uncultured Pluralibacter sp.]|uniref:type VI secretion system amidase immunity protein Tai4 n=1 Tax=uncultured Pluralibacter sp. TaxID=1490864 RepID=UPI0026260F3F|nr:type VI secretion system amidase immunity protein Tai4 [uncultured Pluralibacter sp.]
MNKKRSAVLCAGLIAFWTCAAFAAGESQNSPQASERTYAQNYKDGVLATCIATAYAKNKEAGIDAGSSASALRDWTYYDLEQSPDAVKALVDSYLARDYSNPLAESEIKGIKFDLLKCFDLYHSAALQKLVQRVVMKPNRRWRQDHPAP